MLKRYFLTGLLLILAVLVFANENIIFDIEVTGNKNIDKELIVSILAFAPGDFLTENDISESIKNLYQLGVFNNISIDSRKTAEGIVLNVIVEELLIVNKVTYKGNKKVRKSKIEEITDLDKGSYWSPFLKVEVSQAIIKEYREKGYHSAKVSFDTEILEKNQVNVLVKVDEGKKITIKKIRFHGNKLMPSKKIAKKMKTKKASLFRSGKFDKEKFEEDLDLIITYYKKKGFIDAHIISNESEIIDDKYLYIDIYLVEGNQYRFGSVSISGNTRFNTDILLSNFVYKENELYNQEKFSKQIGKIYNMYYEEGYIYATFDDVLEKDDDKLNIKLTITENTRAKVRQIFIKGNSKTKEKIIRRQLAISPGDYFKQSRVMQSQQNIYNMGFFEMNIGLDYEPINDNGDIDLTFSVQDKTSGSVNGSVGYNSTDSFIGSFSLSQNNLFGNAWKAGLKWEFGGSTQNFELDFTNPYVFDSNTLAGFSIYHTTKEWSSSNYEIFTNGGAIRLGHSVDFLNYSKILGGYSLSSKKYSILNENDIDSSDDYLVELDEIAWQYNSSGNFTFSRDSRDNVFFPSSGSNFTLYSEMAGGPFLGDFDYFKQIAEIKWFTKTFWKLVLRTKWRFGYVTAFGDSDEVPPEERFAPGGTGADQLRGYEDRSVGPNNGGLREILFSTEYACPIAGDQVIGLLFFDAGDSRNKLEHFNPKKFKKGGGLGLRIRSPFGLMGFDYAYNFDEDKWEPHFQFGTTF